MIYRIIMLIIAAFVFWLGYICINADRWGPMFTGTVLMIVGIAILAVTIFCWWEQIMNDRQAALDEEAGYGHDPYS